MLQGLRSQIYQVSDLETAKAWYTQLFGKLPYFDEPFTSASISAAMS